MRDSAERPRLSVVRWLQGALDALDGAKDLVEELQRTGAASAAALAQSERQRAQLQTQLDEAAQAAKLQGDRVAEMTEKHKEMVCKYRRCVALRVSVCVSAWPRMHRGRWDVIEALVAWVTTAFSRDTLQSGMSTAEGFFNRACLRQAREPHAGADGMSSRRK